MLVDVAAVLWWYVNDVQLDAVLGAIPKSYVPGLETRGGPAQLQWAVREGTALIPNCGPLLRLPQTPSVFFGINQTMVEPVAGGRHGLNVRCVPSWGVRGVPGGPEYYVFKNPLEDIV